MKTGRIFVVLAAMMAISGYLLLTPGHAQPGAAGTCQIGVVNLPQIFKESKQIEALKVKFKAEQDAIEAEAKTRKTTLEGLEAKRDGRTTGTKDWNQANRELLEEVIRFKVWMEETQKDLLMRHNMLTQKFYDDSLRIVHAVARERGMHVVLYKEDYEVKAPQLEELLEKIRQKKVLYNSTQADLTPEVIERMNREFKPD